MDNHLGYGGKDEDEVTDDSNDVRVLNGLISPKVLIGNVGSEKWCNVGPE
jgi:hypothetical protein